MQVELNVFEREIISAVLNAHTLCEFTCYMGYKRADCEAVGPRGEYTCKVMRTISRLREKIGGD